MPAEKWVPIDSVVATLHGETRQNVFIKNLLQSIKAEGHTEVQQVIFSSWEPIMLHGDPAPLYVILSGNASVTFPKGLFGAPEHFTEALMRISSLPAPVQSLNDLAECHPLVLSKGDLVGEFEYVQKSGCVSNVIAGTFFKSPETRARLYTTVLHLPDDSAAATKTSLESMTEKLVLLNHLLLPTIHRRPDRINNVLACFFAGLFPVYRVFYRTSESHDYLLSAPDACGAVAKVAKKDGKQFVCLSRLDPFQDPVGIEVSTSYLLRCFGFASRESITADLNGRDVVVYSEDEAQMHAAGEHQGNGLKLDKYVENAREQWRKHSLGPESMLFFLKHKRALEFCSKYGVHPFRKLTYEAAAHAS